MNTPHQIHAAIMRLSARDLAELRRLLDESEEGGLTSGVREPRRPSPSSSRMAIKKESP